MKLACYRHNAAPRLGVYTGDGLIEIAGGLAETYPCRGKRHQQSFHFHDRLPVNSNPETRPRNEDRRSLSAILLIGQRDARTGIPLTGLARWLASVADSGSTMGGQG